MFQKVTVIGRLTADPEMRYTGTGVAVTNFTVATSEKISKQSTPDCPDGWKDGYGGNSWEITTFWKVAVWRGTAENCNQYLAKGRMVYVEGTMNGTRENGVVNPRVWTGSDGIPRASFEMTGRLVKFLGGGNGAGHAGPEDEDDAPPPGFVEENDIPF